MGEFKENAQANFKPVELTPEQNRALEEARVGLMGSCPFFAYYFYAEMKEVFTKDIPTACTDGRTIFINPEYVCPLKSKERVFIYAHEIYHVVRRDPQRFKGHRLAGDIQGKKVDHQQVNQAMDYVINAGLLAEQVGQFNPSWLYDKDTTGEEIWEDVYVRHFKEPPPGGGGQGMTYGQSGRAPSGVKGDATADGNGGGFDQVLEPSVDPVTGKEDVPTDAEFREAIARAATAAKAIGKMPGALQRLVDEILQPQIDWKEHVRMLLTGYMGQARETWERANRRYAALGAMSKVGMPVLPGKRGFGAELVVVAIDTSGSIGEDELKVFFAEVGGVLADVRPKKVILIWCDADIARVDEARTLDELQDIRVKGAAGGGGTDFRPPFHYVEENNLRPDTLIYLTDLMGPFPDKPAYPVVWAATTEAAVPFGDVVRLKI